MLKSKNVAIEKFILYKEEVEKQLINKKIKVIRRDHGGEYVQSFDELCAKHEIICEVTPTYSPQSNGVVEGKNCTVKKIMNAILLSSRLPQNMRGEIILSANYFLNKISKRKEQDTL